MSIIISVIFSGKIIHYFTKMNTKFNLIIEKKNRVAPT